MKKVLIFLVLIVSISCEVIQHKGNELYSGKQIDLKTIEWILFYILINIIYKNYKYKQ